MRSASPISHATHITKTSAKTITPWITFRCFAGGVTRSCTPIGSGPIRIAEIEEDSSVIAKHSFHLAEHPHQAGDKKFWRGLEPDLAIDAAGTALAADVAILMIPLRVCPCRIIGSKTITQRTKCGNRVWASFGRSNVIAPVRAPDPFRGPVVAKAKANMGDWSRRNGLSYQPMESAESPPESTCDSFCTSFLD